MPAPLKLILLILVPFLVFVSCRTEQKDQQQALKEAQKELFNEVMSIHDEVMPKMGSLRSLAKVLSTKADSLALDVQTSNKAQIEEMKRMARDLKKANESMMEWMRQFEQVEEGTPHGEVIDYLTEQRKQIQKVRDDMINSEDIAKKYLSDRF